MSAAPVTRVLVRFYLGRNYDSDVLFSSNADLSELQSALSEFLGGNYDFEIGADGRLLILARPSCMTSLREYINDFLTLRPRREGQPNHWWFATEAYLSLLL